MMEELETDIDGILINGVDIIKFSDDGGQKQCPHEAASNLTGTFLRANLPPCGLPRVSLQFSFPRPSGEARALASFVLDENKLVRLAKAIDALRVQPQALQPLTPFRLGIVSIATSHFMAPALIATAARYGIALECIEANYGQLMQEAYGQLMQEALTADSMINRARPDAVLVALDHRGLSLDVPLGAAGAVEGVVDRALEFIAMHNLCRSSM